MKLTMPILLLMIGGAFALGVNNRKNYGFTSFMEGAIKGYDISLDELYRDGHITKEVYKTYKNAPKTFK